MKPTTLLRLFVLLTPLGLLAGCAPADPFAAPASTPKASAQQAQLDDRAIELAIGKAIYTDPALKHQVHISATSLNGVVLLTGEAPNPALRSKAIDHARRVADVKQVHNEIALGQPSSLASRSEDTLLKARVKLELEREPRLKKSDIKVVVERQSVYLMGRLGRAQAPVATNIVRQIKGVKEVVTLFQYID